MNNQQFSLKTKLLLLCFCLAGISVIVGTTSYFSMHTVSRTYEKVTNNSLPEIRLADHMYLQFKNVRIALRTLGLPGISAAESAKAAQEAIDAIADYEAANKEYRNAPFTDGEKELYDKVEVAWAEFKVVGARVLELNKQNTPDARTKMSEIFFKDCPEKAALYNTAMFALVDFDLKHADLWVRDSREASAKADTWMMIIIATGMIFGMGFGYYFATSVSKSINSVSADLADGAEQVSQASNQIAISSQDLSQSATQQASSLEETVATMEELTAMVKVNSTNAKEAARLGSATREIAVKGETEIRTLIESINSIATDSKKIEEITSVVDDIAFQTNLLALNAAVEAARAGEQGKGFAVVAEAVRNLAQRSSAAAKDIADLIKLSVEKIEAGTVQATQGGKVLGEIVTAVKKVSDLNQEIATASEEQNNGITQIGKALNQLDQVTQQNAAASEEAAAAAEELSAQSVSLKNSVNSLNHVVQGSAADVAAPVRAIHASPASTRSSNVVAMKRPPKKSVASSAIPFDEDDGRAKIGNASDF